MNRIDLIQGLINKHGYKTYLEIGVNTPKQPGYSHDSIKVAIKDGVDPNVETTYKMTSDAFFAAYSISRAYDIIFIDGDHTYEQAYRDIKNSLLILNEGGTIVVHDTNPPTEITTRIPRVSDAWHGDVYKVIARLQIEGGLNIETVDTDEGCTLITKGNSDPYRYFDRNRKDILNLISVYEYKNR